eukprot:9252933-Alexandrium_andersonii.AAC.1
MAGCEGARARFLGPSISRRCESTPSWRTASFGAKPWGFRTKCGTPRTGRDGWESPTLNEFQATERTDRPFGEPYTAA